MPESAHHKDIKLARHSTLKRRTLVDALSEPLLDHDVPRRNFVPRMRRSFNN